MFPLEFRGLKKTHYGPTDGLTDGPRTDRPSYRDAWTHLKTGKEDEFVSPSSNMPFRILSNGFQFVTLYRG